MTVKNGRENYTCSERSKFMEKIKFTKIIENYNLKNYIPEIDTDKMTQVIDNIINNTNFGSPQA